MTQDERADWSVNPVNGHRFMMWLPETTLQVFDVTYRWNSERGYVELPPPPLRPEHVGQRAKRTPCGLGYTLEGDNMEYPFDLSLPPRPRAVGLPCNTNNSN